MAFLDNSGDIILDAVLTDLGRKRMAEGNFKITQFALGDDEIDYRIYNKNHPSGSAYYDLEILQTPVLEAFASANANINYGLVSFNMNLLYMPTMKLWGSNAKDVTITGPAIQRTSGSVYYVGVNNTTTTALLAAMKSDYGDDSGAKYYQHGGAATTDTLIYLETGIDSPTADPSRAAGTENRATYLVNPGLIDTNLDISADSRFFQAVMAPPASSTWKVTGETGGTSASAAVNINTPAPYYFTGVSQAQIANYAGTVVPTFPTKIEATGDTTADDYSQINGPSGYMAGLNFKVQGILGTSAAQYSLFGKTGQDLFGDGNTYDYIDTMVYVSGKTTGVSTHIPIRIVRKVT